RALLLVAGARAALSAPALGLSVATAVAHLAGALGRPVWILLPFDPDWRWLLERGDSPWYPAARLVRQPTLGDWDGVIAKVRAALAGCAAPAHRGRVSPPAPSTPRRPCFPT